MTLIKFEQPRYCHCGEAIPALAQYCQFHYWHKEACYGLYDVRKEFRKECADESTYLSLLSMGHRRLLCFYSYAKEFNQFCHPDFIKFRDRMAELNAQNELVNCDHIVAMYAGGSNELKKL